MTNTGSHGARPYRGLPTPAREIFPVLALVALSVLVPAVLALWFMQHALANERFLAERRATEMAGTQLSSVAERLTVALRERASMFGIGDRQSPTFKAQPRGQTEPGAPSVFARAVMEGNAASAIVYNERGGVSYPSDALRGPVVVRPTALDESPDEEQLRTIARDSQQPAAVRAEALQALLRLGVTDVADVIGDDVLRAVDTDGRASGAMALIGLLRRTGVREGVTWSRLAAIASDYELPIRSSNRRFLLETARDAGALDDVGTRLLEAEQLAEAALPFAQSPRDPSTIHLLPNGDEWLLMSSDGRLGILLHDESMLRLIATEAARVPGLMGTVELATGADETNSLALIHAPEPFPVGMRLLMIANGDTPTAVGSMAVPLTIGLGLLALSIVVTAGALRMTYSRLNLARLRSDLATTVSHELKTPVASTRVLVDTLLDSNLADSAQTREYLELIAKENFRLSRLIENFLLFSRIERGRLSLRPEMLNPSEIATSAMDTLHERAISGARQMESRMDSDLPLIDADREAMSSVLQNLLENAVKHTPEEGGHISIEVKSLDNHVHFIVSDNGEGIPRDQHRRIFDAFHRVDSRLSRTTEGAGLGLSIVRSLVEAHGGQVTVKSEVGKGSTFTITIPASESAP